MSEGMKKYLELLSKDEEARKKLDEYESEGKNEAIKQAIAHAAECGITLTEADFEQPADISDDELEAVAGGDLRACFMAGAGCMCVIVGSGSHGNDMDRCQCYFGGSGQ